jgi:hypothetical protein
MAQFASKEIELQQGSLEVLLHFRGTLHKYKANHGLVLVRELMGWVRNVVLINVYLDLGNPGESGF